MPRPREPLINKIVLKRSEGRCRLCGETDYALLDTHRIQPAAQGGRYTRSNSVVCCSNCHRAVHDQQVIIDRYYPSTGGRRVLRVIKDGVEYFL